MAVGQGSAEALEADDVGEFAGGAEQPAPLPADEDRQVVLRRAADLGRLDADVLAVEVDGLAVDQAPDDARRSRSSRSLRTAGASNIQTVAAYSCGVCPAPRPSSNRPAESRSSVTASQASCTGLRMSLFSTNVPRRIRSSPPRSTPA